MVGLWGIGFFSFDLIRSVFVEHFQAQGLSRPGGRRQAHVLERDHLAGPERRRVLRHLRLRPDHARTSGESPRSPSRSCWPPLATAVTFWFLDAFWQIFVLIPIMGFCQLALFGGYAIYFPELFPTRLRSTGTSFCYNVGRLVAAVGPLTLGLLTSKVFTGYPDPMPARLAGVAMCSVFLVGLLALPFAPETQGQAAAGMKQGLLPECRRWLMGSASVSSCG